MTSEETDPSTWSQERLKNFMEHALFHGMKQHKPGTYERAAYEASFGMIVSNNGPWWRRPLGRWVKWRAERKLRIMREERPPDARS